MKRNRQAAILELIRKYPVTTQEELQMLLRESGYEVTQATISRDIKDLKIVKATDENGIYRYCTTQNKSSDVTEKYYDIIRHAVRSIDFAGNICVIRCDTGMAQAACAAIDALRIDGIVGSLAGDDTIFVLCRTEKDAGEMKRTINQLISGR
ncbi:MAG TPA: arginine repressor [Candidatus Onthovicinus excrementipullorum]|nr:arginine repressor [Candidatus Onthovicinus excrementipullorum]